jgi:glycosyltransferase involved in cell wall biosynthesis
MTAMIPETRMWLQTLPQDIRDSCHQRERIPREDLLKLMAQARVMLSPSLSDGIPNTLYEAMATGSFPILSPLETILAVVANEKNVLFARNLYPQEIADALIRAMNDDQLVDRAYAENLKLVKRLADRKRIGGEVVNFYLDAAESFESRRVP